MFLMRTPNARTVSRVKKEIEMSCGNIMQLSIHTISGKQYVIELDSLEETVLSVRDKVSQVTEVPAEQITLISKGKQLNDLDKTIADYNVTPATKVMLHIRGTSKPTTTNIVASTPTLIPPHVHHVQTTLPVGEVVNDSKSSEDDDTGTSDTDNSDDDSTDNTDCNDDTESSEELTEGPTYTGAQVKEALSKDPYVLLNILQLLSHANPFILSYIATTPHLVKTSIIEQLESQSFRLKIMLRPGMTDPIAHLLTATSVPVVPDTENQYNIDQANIATIVQRVNNPLVTPEYAKDIYLVMDRNVENTINFILSDS